MHWTLVILQVAHHQNFSVFVQEQMEIKFGCGCGDQSNEMGGVGEVISVQHEEADILSSMK